MSNQSDEPSGFGGNGKLSYDDINYAIKNTKVIYEPDRRIDTFGNTTFNYFVLCELMDSINRIRIREGKIEAQKPAIIKPDQYNDFLIEGFGSNAQDFAKWLKDNNLVPAIIQYGFHIKRNEAKENVVSGNLREQAEKISHKLYKKGDPISAVIIGIDDTWEISLLKFTLDMINLSNKTNIFDFKRKGLF